MSRETDIVRAACLMISQYGLDAMPITRGRVHDMGKLAPRAAADWELVASAVQMIEQDAAATIPEGPKLPDFVTELGKTAAKLH